jgi:hypothetical protein
LAKLPAPKANFCPNGTMSSFCVVRPSIVF